MNCKDVQRCVHAFVDEELEPKHIVELETHISNCEACQSVVDFEKWFKAELQVTVGRISAPPSLTSQIQGSLDRAERSQRVRSTLPRVGIAAAIAAGVVAALVLPEWLIPTSTEPQAQRQVIDYVAERHARGLPVEVQGPDATSVARWFRGKVDFAVQPPGFNSDQLQLVGGRMSYVGDRQAAHLVYEHAGRPVTLIVFEDQQVLPLGGVQRQVGNNTVYMGQSRGYNVAVWQNGGVSYAVSSDLAQSDMIQLVSAAQ
jgi:anti-sigma factor RsiW